MRVLLLHGLEARPGGPKAERLAARGAIVVNPALPRESWERSVEIAQRAFDDEAPDVIVGSSRGGALAMNISARATPLVLIAPAWKHYGTATRVPMGTRVLHSRHDDVIPIADSRELLAASGLPDDALVVVGDDHRMRDPAALEALWEAVRALGRATHA